MIEKNNFLYLTSRASLHPAVLADFENLATPVLASVFHFLKWAVVIPWIRTLPSTCGQPRRVYVLQWRTCDSLAGRPGLLCQAVAFKTAADWKRLEEQQSKLKGACASTLAANSNWFPPVMYAHVHKHRHAHMQQATLPLALWPYAPVTNSPSRERVGECGSLYGVVTALGCNSLCCPSQHVGLPNIIMGFLVSSVNRFVHQLIIIFFWTVVIWISIAIFIPGPFPITPNIAIALMLDKVVSL